MSRPTYTDIPSNSTVKSFRSSVNQAFDTAYEALNEKTTDWGTVADSAALASLTDAIIGDTASLADGSLYRLASLPPTTVGNWKKQAQASDLAGIDLSAVVHLAGSETITGAKNFTGGLTVAGTAVASTTDVSTAITTAFQNFNITGQFLGSAATFGTLPTTDAAGKTAGNGDWAVLTADTIGTGSSVNPQYPKGVYVYNGFAFSLVLALQVPTGSNAWLVEIVSAMAFGSMTSITRDVNGTLLTANVTWPDGTSGIFTSDTVSPLFPGVLDAFHVTYIGSSTKTITQPAVTRNSDGSISNRPALTVS